MSVVRSKDFKASRPWGAQQIASMNGVTTKLHWTDKPYKWHVNTGEEVFVVLQGVVRMHYRKAGGEHVATLGPGDIFFAETGCEHFAEPEGEARVLVVELEGSV